MTTNQRVILWERPRYVVPTANCFRVESTAIPNPADGEVRIRTLWLGMDALLYARVQRVSALQGEPLKLKDTMVGPAVGRIDESRNPKYKAGDLVYGLWDWQDYVISSGQRLRKLDPDDRKPSYALGAYGSSGFGGFIALDRLAPPAIGETVVVGTALGGLGHIAGQIAKLKGCRVVGVAGTDKKCELAVNSLGFDACINHQSKDFAALLAQACSKGIDVYVETIGNKVMEAVMPLLNIHARIAACGMMGIPHFGEAPLKGRFQSTQNFVFEIINRRVTLKGLVMFDHVQDRWKEFKELMKGWIDSGAVLPLEDVVEGLENAPAAFQGIFEGHNLGKRVVKIAD